MITANSQRGPRAAGRSMGRQDAPVRNANLAKLLEFVDADVLAAALLMPEDQIRGFVQNREVIKGQSADQLSQYLGYAGFPDGWLDIPGSQANAALAQGLLSLAAEAQNLAPIRRANLKRLAAAFNGRQGILADCLEILEDSLARMLSGLVPFDDQRMGHINPILVRAGFPNNWLETANASLTPDMAQRLEQRLNEPEPEVEPAPAPAGKAHSAPKGAQKAKSVAVAPASGATRIPGLSMGVQRAGRSLTGAAKPVAPKPAAIMPATSRARIDLATRQKHLARAAALAKLLDSARRGAKVCLWRDLLDRDLAYWSNVRGGGIAFRDELADQITHVLTLPQGWLDNPVFPPPGLAAWVTDANVPLPTGPAVQPTVAAAAAPSAGVAAEQPVAAVQAPVVSRKKPVVEKSVLTVPDRTGVFVKQVPTVRKRVRVVAPDVAVEAAPQPQIPTILLATKPVPDAPTVAVAVPAAPAVAQVETPVVVPAGQAVVTTARPAEILPVEAPVETPLAVPAAPAVAPVTASGARPAGLGLELALETGSARAEPGPVACAVAATLLEFSKAGRFSEAEAVRLLAYLHGMHVPR